MEKFDAQRAGERFDVGGEVADAHAQWHVEWDFAAEIDVILRGAVPVGGISPEGID